MNKGQKKRAERFRALKTRVPNLQAGMPVACSKICYDSASKAKSAVKRTGSSGLPKKYGVLTHYWCDNYNAFHIGHNRYWRD